MAQMKAYMSTDGAFSDVRAWRHQNQCGGPLTQAESAAKALAEAQRILADVGPIHEHSAYAVTNKALWPTELPVTDSMLKQRFSDRTFPFRCMLVNRAEAMGVSPLDATPDACVALAESLAVITADGGLLDQLAWSIPTIGQTSAIAHRNSTADAIAAARRDLAVLRAYAESRQ